MNMKVTSIKKVAVLCEFAFINVLNFIFSPFHDSCGFFTVFIFALEFIPILDIHFLALSMEVIVFELSNILKPFWSVLSSCKHVVIVGSVSIWSVGVNEHPIAIGFTIGKLTNVDRAVIFVEFTESARVVHLWT